MRGNLDSGPPGRVIHGRANPKIAVSAAPGYGFYREPYSFVIRVLTWIADKRRLPVNLGYIWSTKQLTYKEAQTPLARGPVLKTARALNGLGGSTPSASAIKPNGLNDRCSTDDARIRIGNVKSGWADNGLLIHA